MLKVLCLNTFFVPRQSKLILLIQNKKGFFLQYLSEMVTSKLVAPLEKCFDVWGIESRTSMGHSLPYSSNISNSCYNKISMSLSVCLKLTIGLFRLRVLLHKTDAWKEIAASWVIRSLSRWKRWKATSSRNWWASIFHRIKARFKLAQWSPQVVANQAPAWRSGGRGLESRQVLGFFSMYPPVVLH